MIRLIRELSLYLSIIVWKQSRNKKLQRPGQETKTASLLYIGSFGNCIEIGHIYMPLVIHLVAFMKCRYEFLISLMGIPTGKSFPFPSHTHGNPDVYIVSRAAHHCKKWYGGMTSSFRLKSEVYHTDFERFDRNHIK